MYIVGHKLIHCSNVDEASQLAKAYNFSSVNSASSAILVFKNANAYLDPATIYVVKNSDESIAFVSMEVPTVGDNGLLDMRRFGYTTSSSEWIQTPTHRSIMKILMRSDEVWMQVEMCAIEDYEVFRSWNFVTYCKQKPEINMLQRVNNALKGDFVDVRSMIGQKSLDANAGVLFAVIGSKVPIEMRCADSNASDGIIQGRDFLMDDKIRIDYVDIAFTLECNDVPFHVAECYGITDKYEEYVHLCAEAMYKKGEILLSIPITPWNVDLLKRVNKIVIDYQFTEESRLALSLEKERFEKYREQNPF